MSLASSFCLEKFRRRIRNSVLITELLNFHKKIDCMCNDYKQLIAGIWNTFVMSVKMIITYEINMNTYDRRIDLCYIQVLFISHFWHIDGGLSLGISVAEKDVWLYFILLLIRSLSLLSNSLAGILSGWPIPIIAIDFIKLTDYL